MSSINQFLTCPEACSDSYLLPALPADPWCVNTPGRSQIHSVVIAPCGTAAEPFVNDGADTVTLVTPAEIDNDNADNTKSRQLVGIGSVAEHEATEVQLPLRRTAIVERLYTLTHRVPLADDATYNFMKALQCNYLAFRFWYVDMADKLYGTTVVALSTTPGGIIPSKVNVQFPKGDGDEDRNYAVLEIQWYANGEPPRYDSPLVETAACALP